MAKYHYSDHEDLPKRFRSEHRAWYAAMRRCTNKKDQKWKYYGGRGITFCSEWLHSFAAFLNHIGPKPSNKHILDRIDNDQGYRHGNVRWATTKQSAINRRGTIQVEYLGETLFLHEWAKRYDLPVNILRNRLQEKKWPVEKALLTPYKIDGRRPGTVVLHYQGRSLSLLEWAKELGISKGTVKDRYRRGMPIEMILSRDKHRSPRRLKPRKDSPLFTYQGETRTILEWSRIMGISFHALHARLLYRGWSIEKSLTTPVRSKK